ncbi:MAG: YceD family protein [Bacteroidota bacterium]
MGRSRDYVIEFGSLPKGEHEFEFEVSDTFFQEFEHSIVQHGNVDVLVVLEKKENLLLLDFTLSGTVTVTCDRCLDDLELELEGYSELIVKLGDHSEEESDEVIMIPVSEHQLDLSQFIYEYVTVMIPMRNVHPDNEDGTTSCNPEILRQIERHQHQENSEEPDPRWEALKKINLN